MDYIRNGGAQAFTAVPGTGDFTVGMGSTDGAEEHHLPGRITDVRLWAGVMAGEEQIETRVGD